MKIEPLSNHFIIEGENRDQIKILEELLDKMNELIEAYNEEHANES